MRFLSWRGLHPKWKRGWVVLRGGNAARHADGAAIVLRTGVFSWRPLHPRAAHIEMSTCLGAHRVAHAEAPDDAVSERSISVQKAEHGDKLPHYDERSSTCGER